jgi:hypothetical protein
VGPIRSAFLSAGFRLAILAVCVLLFPLAGGPGGSLLRPHFGPWWPPFVSHPANALAPSSDTPKNRAKVHDIRNGAVAVGSLGGLVLLGVMVRRRSRAEVE